MDVGIKIPISVLHYSFAFGEYIQGNSGARGIKIFKRRDIASGRSNRDPTLSGDENKCY